MGNHSNERSYSPPRPPNLFTGLMRLATKATAPQTMPDQPLIAQNLTEDITPPQTNTSCRKSTFGFIPIMKNTQFYKHVLTINSPQGQPVSR